MVATAAADEVALFVRCFVLEVVVRIGFYMCMARHGMRMPYGQPLKIDRCAATACKRCCGEGEPTWTGERSETMLLMALGVLTSQVE